MQSKNFEHLKPTWADLATLGAFAEQYTYADPQSAVAKLRTFAEQIALFVYHTHGLPKPLQTNLNDLLTSASFQHTVPRVVITKLHTLRIQGNKGAHGESVLPQSALSLLQDAYELGLWMFLNYGNGKKEVCPPFTPPSPTEGTELEKKLRREKVSILQRLAAQEAEMKKVLLDLQTARSQIQIAEQTAVELQAAQIHGQQIADVLAFDEATTRRRLIDTMLSSADWKVGSNGKSNEQVGQEIDIDNQPTATKKGRADYVLWGANGKPIGVVEAKKTAVEPDLGRTQAKFYADGLEKTYGQRPIIFYTNGYDIWIWNDASGEPPRKVYGFYSLDSLEYLLYQRSNKESLLKTAPNPHIAGRIYQLEAIKRVVERFTNKHRSALIVQATGTGKTRVAISLCDVLLRAKWAKRVLLLCDRKELRKQAYNTFKEHLPGEPRTYVTSATSKDRDKRVYLSTYPAMMECYESFDVGFFDLIIADESHRSIYNRFREIFSHFDCLQVGLTATPVEFIARNTYKIFGCEDRDPTAYFSFEDAINSIPPYLVPFEVISFTTHFLRKGIKYSEMSKEQQRELEENEQVPSVVEFEQSEVDRTVFNKDTNRVILRNLMENGIRDATGSKIGKSIIFARNHKHAVILQGLFDEMYPQYGGQFCRVIDTHDSRAEELIDDFKGEGSNPDLTVAISVDMLDTGIDVPKIVNLVFAKPVYSYVKFWQMIGRGTRLSPNLFGPGKDKTHFLIFDHWKNFEFFDREYKPAEPQQAKSLAQLVFENRMKLVENGFDQANASASNLAFDLIAKDIADLPNNTIAVKEKWKEIKSVSNPERLRQFEAPTKNMLLYEIAPLMQWRNLGGNESAYKFDLLVCRLQNEHLKNSSTFYDLKAELQGQLNDLRMNLSQVKAVAPLIVEARSDAYWRGISIERLEELRTKLRGVMQYRQSGAFDPLPPKVIDIKENEGQFEINRHPVKLEGLQLAAYRNRVEKVLRELFETNETLKRIKIGQPVSVADLDALTSLVLTQDPLLNLHDLVEYYPDCAGQLDVAIRGIIGLDAEEVSKQFTKFVQQHSALNSMQIRFLDLIQNHIARYGSIAIDRLYESPFTSIHTDSIDGLFPDDEQATEIIEIIRKFQPTIKGPSTE